MNDPASQRATSLLRDIASSSQFAEISRLLNALRYLLRSSLRAVPGGSHGAMAQEVRRQSRIMPTSALRASVHQTLQLLDTRPPVDPQAYAASRPTAGHADVPASCRRRLNRATASPSRAIRPARRRDPQGLGCRDPVAQAAAPAGLSTVSGMPSGSWRSMSAGRLRALYDWQLEHLQQLVQGRWQAQALLDRQKRALDKVMAAPPAYLLSELGDPPRPPEAREVWRQGALAILRFRKDYEIQDPDRALGEPSVGASQRLRRSQVEVVIDQARQLIDQPRDPFALSEPLTVFDLDVP